MKQPKPVQKQIRKQAEKPKTSASRDIFVGLLLILLGIGLGN